MFRQSPKVSAMDNGHQVAVAHLAKHHTHRRPTNDNITIIDDTDQPIGGDDGREWRTRTNINNIMHPRRDMLINISSIQ